MRSENHQRILFTVGEALEEERRKAEIVRKQLTLELHEQTCCAIEEEKQKTKEVEMEVEHLKMVSTFTTMLIKLHFVIF